MKLKKIGSNMTQLDMPNGDAILISYETPVAKLSGNTVYVTGTYYSRTTSKHINKFVRMHDAQDSQRIVWDQKFLDRELGVSQ